MRQSACRTLLSLLLIGSVSAGSPVQFVDPSLKAAVEAELWVVDPTPTDMLDLTYLYAGGLDIADLTGLDYALNLQTLRLPHNRIRTISALSGLTNLQTLALNTNAISDISALSGMTRLEELILHDNQISNVSPLSGLTDLRTLDLHANAVVDISPLSGLVHLDRLLLEDNEVGDISALSGLTELQYLRIGINHIHDLWPLSGLTNLETLSAHNNQISNLSALAALARLETLVLSANQIGDISPLSSLTSLRYLDLNNNPLNAEACATYIPLILANNAGISVKHDACVVRHLLISSTTGGSVVDPGEGRFTYADGEVVRIEAQAEPGFVFVAWSGSHSSTVNPLSITIGGDYDIQAHFARVDEDPDDPDPDDGDDPDGDLMPPAGYTHILYVDANAPGDPGPTDPTVSDPLEDGSEDHPFDRIQEALDGAAFEGFYVLVRPGVYRENIDLLGKRVALVGIDPRVSVPRPYPVLEGSGIGPAVRFVGSEDRSCLMRGFVITGGTGDRGAAITCRAASPTIANCLIVGNRSNDPNGAAVYCEKSRALLVNCTIADNYAGSLGAGLYVMDSEITLRNAILWNNAPTDLLVNGTGDISIQYCDVVDGWPGTGNLDADPLFAKVGSWADPNDPNAVVGPQDSRAVWVDGDYHLQSQAGRWDPNTSLWVRDVATSPCIDAGDVYSPVGEEPSPNGSLVNLGAYGGTPGASRSPSPAPSP